MSKPASQPRQKQHRQPGKEHEMTPEPETISPDYKAAGKLEGKVALITGGDSGIGRAVAVHFAKEGADIAIIYLDESDDAEETRRMVEEAGRRFIGYQGDIGDPDFGEQCVEETVRQLGGLNILVNNAAEQHPEQDFLEIKRENLESTFRTNILAMMYLTQAALPHMQEGDTIINTTSVTAYEGNQQLIDYSSTKGAIVAFTRSLGASLAQKGIRVNGVAPGPIWTPLIPATFPEEKVEKFGKNTPMGRAGQPSEVAPCFVFLASQDSSYITSQILHPNGGRVVNG